MTASINNQLYVIFIAITYMENPEKLHYIHSEFKSTAKLFHCSLINSKMWLRIIKWVKNKEIKDKCLLKMYSARKSFYVMCVCLCVYDPTSCFATEICLEQIQHTAEKKRKN